LYTLSDLFKIVGLLEMDEEIIAKLAVAQHLFTRRPKKK
jgi:hypothetical protein